MGESLEMDDTEVTLERNPKTDGLRRATQKADVHSFIRF